MARFSSHDDWRFGHMAAVGNAVEFSCVDCKAAKTWSGRRLVERFTADGTLGVVGPRLRCPDCGSARISAFVVGTGEGWHPASAGDQKPTLAEQRAADAIKARAAAAR